MTEENLFEEKPETSTDLPKCYCGKGVRIYIQTATIEAGFCSEKCFENLRKPENL